MEHTALANQEREIREQLGYTVTIENQNLFRLRAYPNNPAALRVMRAQAK